MSDLEAQYQAVRAGRKSLSDTATELQNAGGLSTLEANRNGVRQNITSTEKLLRNLPADVQTRGRDLGGPVTQAMLDRLTAAKQQPLTMQLGDLSKADTNATGAINDLNTVIGNKINLIGQERASEDADWVRRLQVEKEQQAQAAQNALQQWIMEQQTAGVKEAQAAEEKRKAEEANSKARNIAYQVRAATNAPPEKIAPLEQTLNQVIGSGIGLNYRNPIFDENGAIMARQPSANYEVNQLVSNLLPIAQSGNKAQVLKILSDTERINGTTAQGARATLQRMGLI